MVVTSGLEGGQRTGRSRRECGSEISGRSGTTWTKRKTLRVWVHLEVNLCPKTSNFLVLFDRVTNESLDRATSSRHTGLGC